MDVLSEIHEDNSSLTQRDICDRCDVSKSTAHRVVKSLTGEGILRKHNGGYVLTDLGKALTDKTIEYVSKVGTLEEANDEEGSLGTVLKTGLTAEQVVNANITRSSDKRPFAALTRLKESVCDAKEVYVLTNSVAHVDSVTNRKVGTDERKLEIIFDRRIAESVGDCLNDKDGERIETERAWIHRETVPYQITVVDGSLCYGVGDENNVPVYLLETEEAEAVEWAESVFKEYKENTVRFSNKRDEKEVPLTPDRRF